MRCSAQAVVLASAATAVSAGTAAFYDKDGGAFCAEASEDYINNCVKPADMLAYVTFKNPGIASGTCTSVDPSLTYVGPDPAFAFDVYVKGGKEAFNKNIAALNQTHPQLRQILAGYMSAVKGCGTPGAPAGLPSPSPSPSPVPPPAPATPAPQYLPCGCHCVSDDDCSVKECGQGCSHDKNPAAPLGPDGLPQMVCGGYSTGREVCSTPSPPGPGHPTPPKPQMGALYDAAGVWGQCAQGDLEYLTKCALPSDPIIYFNSAKPTLAAGKTCAQINPSYAYVASDPVLDFEVYWLGGKLPFFEANVKFMLTHTHIINYVKAFKAANPACN